MSQHSLLPPGLLPAGVQSSTHYRDGQLDTGIPVRAVNESDAPIMWMYDRVKYILNPGVPTFIPYLAMCLYQGDPRAIDLPTGRPQEQYRRNEYARLRIHCGVYEDDSRWDDCPHLKVTCYPIDSDVPFNTVLRDPEGTSQGAEKRDMSQTQFLQQQLEQTMATVRVLQAQVAAGQSAEQAMAAANFDPADLDRQATISKALSPEEATGESMVGARPVQKSAAAKKRPAAGEGPAVTTDA